MLIRDALSNLVTTAACGLAFLLATGTAVYGQGNNNNNNNFCDIVANPGGCSNAPGIFNNAGISNNPAGQGGPFTIPDPTAEGATGTKTETFQMPPMPGGTLPTQVTVTVYGYAWMPYGTPPGWTPATPYAASAIATGWTPATPTGAYATGWTTPIVTGPIVDGWTPSTYNSMDIQWSVAR